MTIKLPKDAAGREIPLDTTKLFGASGECENEMGACDNGFECSVCGCRVEDEEHYHVSGTWNFCPQCGRKVVNHAY